MDLGLEQKRALVLGASRGLGKAVALALLEEGAIVAAAARNTGQIHAWAHDLPEPLAARLTALEVDMADQASVTRLGDRLQATGDDVSIIVNNGGGPPPGAAAAVGDAQWEGQFRTMAIHPFSLIRRLLPAMIARKWGRIITIGSSGIEQPIANLAISNAVRSAVAAWSKTLANEVATEGVTVNLVLPGRIHTDRVDELDSLAAAKQGKSVDEIAAASRAAIPAGRYGQPREFGAAVAFLASERASYITGTSLRVDGGLIRSR